MQQMGRYNKHSRPATFFFSSWGWGVMDWGRYFSFFGGSYVFPSRSWKGYDVFPYCSPSSQCVAKECQRMAHDFKPICFGQSLLLCCFFHSATDLYMWAKRGSSPYTGGALSLVIQGGEIFKKNLQKTINFGSKLSFILVFLFIEHVHCCYIITIEQME
jgi:hypothetical protein